MPSDREPMQDGGEGAVGHADRGREESLLARDSTPHRPKSRARAALSRALWALAALAAALLAIGAATSRALAVSGAILLAGCAVALLLEGVSRGWEISTESPEARRRVGVRTAVRIGAALLIVSVACASAFIGWSGLAITSSVFLSILALVGGPAWLAGVAETERDARLRSTDAGK